MVILIISLLVVLLLQFQKEFLKLPPPFNPWGIHRATLYCIHDLRGSQWSSLIMDVMWLWHELYPWRTMLLMRCYLDDKGQDKNNMSCVQLHHPSQLMKPWSKVNVKQVNQLWCSQSNPRPISLYGLSDGRTHVQMDGRTDFRHY